MGVVPDVLSGGRPIPFEFGGVFQGIFRDVAGLAGQGVKVIVDPDIRNLVKEGADSVTIKEKAVEKGRTTLFEDGLEKIKAGITTIDEVMRVSQE